MTLNRRHFMQHVAGASAIAGPSAGFIQNLHAAEENLKKQGKSLVVFWMGGGPSHMDLWDLKPGAQTGGVGLPACCRCISARAQTNAASAASRA